MSVEILNTLLGSVVKLPLRLYGAVNSYSLAHFRGDLH
jgi:hypothetical protein